MTVWIVEQVYDYESGGCEGVFSTEALAVAAARKVLARLGCRVYVTTVVVDGEQGESVEILP